MVVFVFNKHGRALMPCSPRIARKLLKDKCATVLKLEPFTIKLLYGTTGYTQQCVLGIDKGSSYTGVSVVSEQKVLISAKVNHRLESVKLTPSQGANNSNGDEKHHAHLFLSAVSKPEITAPNRMRLFSCAVTSSDDRDHGRPSPRPRRSAIRALPAASAVRGCGPAGTQGGTRLLRLLERRAPARRPRAS